MVNKLPPDVGIEKWSVVDVVSENACEGGASLYSNSFGVSRGENVTDSLSLEYKVARDGTAGDCMDRTDSWRVRVFMAVVMELRLKPLELLDRVLGGLLGGTEGEVDVVREEEEVVCRGEGGVGEVGDN